MLLRFGLVIGFLLGALSSHAVDVRIDFGDADGGAYNTIARRGANNAGETDVEGVRFSLEDNATGGDSGITVMLEDVPGNTDFSGPADWGDNKSTGSYAGPHPDIFSDVDASALSDGFFLKNRAGGNSVTISFSGLQPSRQYSMVLYGARGGTVDSSSTFTLSAGEPVGAASGTIEHILNNTSETVSLSAVSTPAGELSIKWVSSGANNSGAALNYMQLTGLDLKTLGLITD